MFELLGESNIKAESLKCQIADYEKSIKTLQSLITEQPDMADNYRKSIEALEVIKATKMLKLSKMQKK